MSEHRIRLRKGWERVDAGRLEARGLRGEEAARGVCRAVYRRRFGRPRLDAARECVRLVLEGVTGLVRVVLNGEERALIWREGGYELALGMVLERNTLLLELEVGACELANLGPEPPGEIRLVIAAVGAS